MAALPCCAREDVEAGAQPCVSTGRSIHAMPSITPSLREGIEDSRAWCVIADITNPKSAPRELQATVPEIMVPFRSIIEEGEKPFAMLQDLRSKHRDWVFEPIHYSSVDALIASLDEKIIQPAEARFVELVRRKAEPMGGEHV
jgi:hypothetical protein